MNLNPLPWLRACVIRSEVKAWTACGLIQSDQEQRICREYDQKCCGMDASALARLTLYAFSAVAMLVALALVTADHWRQIPLAFKLVVCVVSMLVAHGAGYWYQFHQNKGRLGEACFFAGTILYGFVVLSLLDQYYFGTAYWSPMVGWGLFLWAAGSLPLAWVRGSIPLLLLSDVLGFAWVLAHVRNTSDAAITILFAMQGLCLIRWAYTNRSRSLLLVTLISLLLWWSMLVMAEGLGRAGVFWIAAAAPLLGLIGLRHEESHPFTPIYKRVGISLAGLVIPLLALPSVSDALMRSRFGQNDWLLIGVVLAIIILYVPSSQRFDYQQYWLVLVALLSVTAIPAMLRIVFHGSDFVSVGTAILTALFNAAAVAVVVWLIKRGAVADCMGNVAAGIAYFSVWATLLAMDMVGRWTELAVVFALSAAATLVAARLYLQKKVA
jgi:hypothetical protein